MSKFVRSLDIGNAENWGKLVKSWATGRNYFNPGAPPPALPNTVDELVATANAHGCNVTKAKWVSGLAIISYSHETLALRLPPKAMIERSEALLRGEADPIPPEQGGGEPLERGQYDLPDFYTDFLKIKEDQRTVNDLLKFHHERIGEYTVNSCA